MELLEKFNINALSYLSNYNKILLKFPLIMLKYYSEKIFISHCLTLCHKNKYFESLINIVLTDRLLDVNLELSIQMFNFHYFFKPFNNNYL